MILRLTSTIFNSQILSRVSWLPLGWLYREDFSIQLGHYTCRHGAVWCFRNIFLSLFFFFHMNKILILYNLIYTKQNWRQYYLSVRNLCPRLTREMENRASPYHEEGKKSLIDLPEKKQKWQDITVDVPRTWLLTDMCTAQI